MTAAKLACRVEARRELVRGAGVNGIDFLEVDDDQRSLCVRFLGRVPDDLVPENVVIEGGVRERDIRVLDLDIRHSTDPELDDCLEVAVDRPGDFSTYTLRLVVLDEEGRPTDRPYPGFDPRYASIEFSFKAGCPSPLDCAGPQECPPSADDEPVLDYLAKDYASFRQLILDRLATVMPAWQERHVPDLYLALVEILAYAGDHLSYHQDAVATEAYLETARRRISVRRHARLVDYLLHEGCTARAWVSLDTDTDVELDLADLRLTTGQGEGAALPPDSLDELVRAGARVYEPVGLRSGTVWLRRAHNVIRFHTWGDRECCLAAGATAVVLRDVYEQPRPPQDPDAYGADDAADEPPRRGLQLQPGDVLVLEEVRGPLTGVPGDRDPDKRHAVRLRSVRQTEDPLFRVHLPGSELDVPLPLVEVEWEDEDALPFPLCISSLGRPPECELIEDVSVARANVLLVDHGRSFGPEDLGTVDAEEDDTCCEGEGRPGETQVRPRRFDPVITRRPLTFAEPVPEGAPASRLLTQNPRRAVPQVRLVAALAPPRGDEAWEPRPDLLGSGPDDRHFVAEIDDDGQTRLRFGDGSAGALPAAGASFSARYRIGNGADGNVGANAIGRVIARGGTLSGIELTVTNPLPATGGVDPESTADAKQLAPHTFRAERVRAVVPEDYAELAERNTAVQQAAAELRWTGSWYRLAVSVDAKGGVPAPAQLVQKVRRDLYPYRRIGHDLAVGPAVAVPLEIELLVCVQPEYLQGVVLAEVLDALGRRRLPDGRLGFFHPDNLTFGQGVYISALVAAAQAVPGVASVHVKQLERLFEGPAGEIAAGVLTLGPNEIARLDNDPSFPEHGRLRIDVRGGR